MGIQPARAEQLFPVDKDPEGLIARAAGVVPPAAVLDGDLHDSIPDAVPPRLIVDDRGRLGGLGLADPNGLSGLGGLEGSGLGHGRSLLRYWPLAASQASKLATSASSLSAWLFGVV